jgi:hypothetical protein
VIEGFAGKNCICEINSSRPTLFGQRQCRYTNMKKNTKVDGVTDSFASNINTEALAGVLNHHMHNIKHIFNIFLIMQNGELH